MWSVQDWCSCFPRHLLSQWVAILSTVAFILQPVASWSHDGSKTSSHPAFQTGREAKTQGRKDFSVKLRLIVREVKLSLELLPARNVSCGHPNYMETRKSSV